MRIVVILCMVLSVGVSSTAAWYSQVQLRMVRTSTAAASRSVSDQLTTIAGANSTLEDDVVQLKQRVDELTTVTVRPATVVSAPASEKAVTAAVVPSASPAGLINLNTASQEQLTELPGIGTAYAERIIAARPFTSVDQLDSVKGIGVKTVEKLRSLVTVQ